MNTAAEAGPRWGPGPSRGVHPAGTGTPAPESPDDMAELAAGDHMTAVITDDGSALLAPVDRRRSLVVGRLAWRPPRRS